LGRTPKEVCRRRGKRKGDGCGEEECLGKKRREQKGEREGMGG